MDNLRFYEHTGLVLRRFKPATDKTKETLKISSFHEENYAIAIIRNYTLLLYKYFMSMKEKK